MLLKEYKCSSSVSAVTAVVSMCGPVCSSFNEGLDTGEVIFELLTVEEITQSTGKRACVWVHLCVLGVTCVEKPARLGGGLKGGLTVCWLSTPHLASLNRGGGQWRVEERGNSGGGEGASGGEERAGEGEERRDGSGGEERVGHRRGRGGRRRHGRRRKLPSTGVTVTRLADVLAECARSTTPCL